MTTKLPPEQIYLQCYNEAGELLNLSHDDVDWCVDQINEKDAIYILATLELATLLERLAEIVPAWGDWADHRADLDEAHALATHVREALKIDNS